MRMKGFVFFTVRLPPTIIKGPQMHRIFRGDARIDMICVATASVDIRYVCTYLSIVYILVHIIRTNIVEMLTLINSLF